MHNNSFEKQHLFFLHFSAWINFPPPLLKFQTQSTIRHIPSITFITILLIYINWKWASESSALQYGYIVVLIDKGRTGTQMMDKVMPGSLGKVQKKKRHGYMTPHTWVEDLRNDKSNWNMFSFGIPKFLTLILELSLTCSLLRTNWTKVIIGNLRQRPDQIWFSDLQCWL